MATDKSEPRIAVIFQVAIGAVVTLVVLRAGLVSYFDRITQGEAHRKIVSATPIALISLRAQEQERLNGGAEPIDKAMHDLAAKGRTASPDIAPTNSRDVAPLQGWSRMPAQVPAMMMAPPPPEASAAASTADGGPAAHETSDAGPARLDGGAQKKKP